MSERIERYRSRQSRPGIDIGEALNDPRLLGHALGEVDSWDTWLVALRAAYGLPLDQRQLQVFTQIAGGRQPPTRRVRELWCVIGRRAGKSRMAAAISAHSALLQTHTLAPGETGYALVLSQTRDQAGLVLDYAHSFIAASPVLRQQIASVTANEIRLQGHLTVAVHPNSFRSVRGRTLICAILDESAFWRDENSALPDIEAYRAILPALASTNGLLVGISTPYRKSGLLYDKYKNHFGHDDAEVLVIRGDTRTFNPTIPAAVIDSAMADDPEAALAEWAAEFRTDLSAFLSEADVDRAIDPQRAAELPPQDGVRYYAFVDVSGGRHDPFALAIGHRDTDDRIVLDVIRAAQPPFDPHTVTGQYGALLRQYRLSNVTGDNFAAEWAASAFAAAKIRYQKCEWPKSKLYIEALPAFARGLVSLPDLKALRRELLLLERRTHVGGKDTVDHGRAGHDDMANCVAGLIHLAQARPQRAVIGTFSFGYATPGQSQPDERCRVRFVKVSEAVAPAARGPSLLRRKGQTNDRPQNDRT